MPTPTAYDWDTPSQRFRERATGRYIDSQTVRAEVDNFIAAQRERAAKLTEQLFSRTITLGAWQGELEQTLKNMHIAASASAKGGFSRMTQADYERVGQTVRQEYAYLSRFAQQLEAGTQPLNGKVLQRVNGYLNHSRTSYEVVHRLGMKAAGYDVERNLVNPAAAHCAECDELADQGWVPIGSHPPPGQRTCGSNCACSLHYGRSSEELEVAA